MTSEDIPPIPEPEFSFLRSEILKLLYPNVIGIDSMKINVGSVSEHYANGGSRPWGENHNFQLRLMFLRFFALFLSGYRNFIENTASNIFNSQAFLKKRSRATGQTIESMAMITQFLESQGFLDYVERCVNSEQSSHNLLDKLQDATGRSQSPATIFPPPLEEPEIIAIAIPDNGTAGARYRYRQFPSNTRTEEQEEKRRSILTSASGSLSGRYTPSSPSVIGLESKAESLSPRERAAERERMVLDIKVKLQGLWLRLLRLGATEDPLSFEYGTILALIESDAEGIGGSGFVECIGEHIHSGWQCRLTDEQFIAVKELLKTTINRATSRNDMSTVKDALEVSAEMYRRDSNSVPDYVQRHLLPLSVWDELRLKFGILVCVVLNFEQLSKDIPGERVLMASHDGTVKMWDVRTDMCVAIVGRSLGAVFCMEYDDSTGILAAAGRDVPANIWDIRAGRQMHKLLGHTKWIRSIRMVGDTLLTGSDDWTARMWSVSRGTCDAVLACHAGPVLSVEHSSTDKGVITGSADGLVRFWESDEGGIKCAKNVALHSSSILSINAGEHWLGIGAADNSMSFFHRPQERLGGFSSAGSKMAGWQLYRTPQRSVAMVRCVASDLDRKRICSGSRNGLLWLWEATINI